MKINKWKLIFFLIKNRLSRSENVANKLFELYRCALDHHLDPYERYQASKEAFSLMQTTQWDEQCGIPKTIASFVFLLTKVEFELVNSYLENGDELDGLIESCEKFLPDVVSNPDAQCYLQENLTKLYITRIKENTVEYLSEALTAIQKLPKLDKAEQLHHKVALIFIITELLKEKLFNFTKQPEYITSPDHIEKALETCFSSKDGQVIFEASQMVGEYYLLTIQGNREENIERALEIFSDQKKYFELSDTVAPEYWCKICEKLGDSYAARIKGDRYKNIHNALEFYNTAFGISDEAPLDKYPRKQRFINALKMADMLIERNQLDDAHIATELIQKENKAEPKPMYQSACYFSFVTAKSCAANDKFLHHKIAFDSLYTMEATFHTEYSARFHYEAKILTATILLQSHHSEKKNILEEKLAGFQETLKNDKRQSFPVESVKMHILCGDILKALSRASYQPQLLHYEAALEIAKEYDLTYLLAIIYLRIGEVYASQSSHVFNTPKAIGLYQLSLKCVNKDHQINVLMEAELYLITAFCSVENWKAASDQSMEMLDFIDAKKPHEMEQIFNIINRVKISPFISLLPYTHLMLGDIKKGLMIDERLKIQSIHHKLLFEMIRFKGELSSETLNLFCYQFMARHVISGQVLSYQMKVAVEDFLKKAQTAPLEYQSKYGFSLEFKDIEKQLGELEEWVFIPAITPIDTHLILIAPQGRSQQIILSEPVGADATHYTKTIKLWIEALFALKEEGSKGNRRFDEIVFSLPQLLYLVMGKWIGDMVKEHAIPQNQHLIIIPPTLISNLPLGLTAIDKNNTLLQDYFTLSIAPSITAINGIRKRFQDTYDNTLTHVYVPEESLKFSTFERSVISNFLNNACVQNIEATNTDSIFSTSEFFNSTYLHLQLHGQHHFTYSEESFLSLAGGDSLKSDDLVRMAPSQFQRLVTLTSCEAGMASYMKTGAIHNFATVMMLSGAMGVVAPLWEVNSMATCILMIRFYENHFVQKHSPPYALKSAQLWIREATTDDIILYIENHTDKNDLAIAEKADELIFELEKRDPDEKPFAAPQYWAAFMYFGL